MKFKDLKWHVFQNQAQRERLILYKDEASFAGLVQFKYLNLVVAETAAWVENDAMPE